MATVTKTNTKRPLAEGHPFVGRTTVDGASTYGIYVRAPSTAQNHSRFIRLEMDRGETIRAILSLASYLIDPQQVSKATPGDTLRALADHIEGKK